ncbi:MAG: hypothetical protein GEV12_13625 [Micromonosporaceae bacterium]|nr:hypothetical protein [Micromonosporaceae bacterium]
MSDSKPATLAAIGAVELMARARAQPHQIAARSEEWRSLLGEDVDPAEVALQLAGMVVRIADWTGYELSELIARYRAQLLTGEPDG